MKAGLIHLLALAFALVLPTATRAQTKPVMVHYMPWFQAKPYSSSWGYHWTLGSPAFNPDQFYTNGQRVIASHYYPSIGPYDSLDPIVLEYHVLLMKLAGVDGVIVDWYGHETYLDYGRINQCTAALFNQTKRAGLKFSICYEDRTVERKITGGYITAGNAVLNAQQSMQYLETNYFSHPSYLQMTNKPVLLNFGPIYFKTNSQWVSIFSVLSNQPAFFTEDIKYAAGVGAFNWPPMSLAGGAGGTLTTNQLNNYLNNFDTQGNTWPAFISSAFPRFRDFYQQAGAGSSHGTLDDRNGQTFRETLRRAVTNSSDAVQVVTWNDFGEGTIVEPTVEFGYRDLGVIQDFRRQYLQPDFKGTTNDLSMALRFYNLRRQFASYPTMTAELGRIFTNIVSGELETANRQLSGMEAGRVVMYDFSSNSNQLQFAIGGYVLGGAQVLATTNLFGGPWQIVRTFPPSTNLTIFSTNIVLTNARRFFKLQ